VLMDQCQSANKLKQLQSDFGIDHQAATIFWGAIRNGLVHQAMPKIEGCGQKKCGWSLRA
jgi:hypothetical protein